MPFYCVPVALKIPVTTDGTFQDDIHIPLSPWSLLGDEVGSLVLGNRQPWFWAYAYARALRERRDGFGKSPWHTF